MQQSCGGPGEEGQPYIALNTVPWIHPESIEHGGPKVTVTEDEDHGAINHCNRGTHAVQSTWDTLSLGVYDGDKHLTYV